MNYGFGFQPSFASMSGLDPSQQPPAMQRMTPVSVDPSSFIAPPTAPTPAAPDWKPSTWRALGMALRGDGDIQGAKDKLTQEHLSQLFAARDAQLMQAAMDGKSADQQFAIHHDPNSFATNANQHFGFHIIPGGDSAVDGGNNLGIAPKVSSPAESATAANGAVTAAAEAEKARLQGLVTPAQIQHLKDTGTAALIAARRQPAGARPGGGQDIFGAYGLKPGAGN